jgi:hypothetical protein
MKIQTKDKTSQSGGVALEYLLVTTFAAITGIAALGIAGSIIKDKIENMAKKLEIPIEDVSFNPFDN